MKVGSCGVLDLSRVYPKTPFEPMFYSWWNCPLSAVQTFNSFTGRSDVCQCLIVQTPMGNMSKNKLNTSMINVHVHVACESKLGSVVRSSMRP